MKKGKMVFSDNAPTSTSPAAMHVKKLWGHPPYGPEG
jgi:hypothetical protein